MSKQRLTVSQVKREYNVCIRSLREQTDPKAVFMGTSDGKPVTVYAIRHYCRVMKVLFDRIRELEKSQRRFP